MIVILNKIYLIYFSLSATQRKVTKEKSPLGKCGIARAY